MRFSSFATAIAFSALFASAAFALDAAQPTPSSSPAVDAAAKTAKSADCYRQADVKNLHGKDRKKFHRECMKAQ